jgi:hypothetical protein
MGIVHGDEREVAACVVQKIAFFSTPQTTPFPCCLETFHDSKYNTNHALTDSVVKLPLCAYLDDTIDYADSKNPSL